MKSFRKLSALFLALALLLGIALTGCGSEKETQIAAPDEIAQAYFDMIIRNDASTAQRALGYASEADARKDMLGSDEDIFDLAVDEMIESFEEMGATVSAEDGKMLLDAVMEMLGKIEFSATVKEMDEDARTAVVTCKVGTFDPEASANLMTNAMMKMDLEEITAIGDDPNALVHAIVPLISEVMRGLEPSGDTAEFDANFSLKLIEVNGEPTKVWVPDDPEQFGSDISTHAMGS